MFCGLKSRHTTVVTLFGELYDQNSVFSGHTHEHHKSYLEIDVIFKSESPRAKICAQYCHRKRQQHCERHCPAFIQSGKEEKYKQKHQSEYHSGLWPGTLLLIAESAPLHADIRRKMRAGKLLHMRHRIARTVALGRITHYQRRIKHVETAYGARAGSIACRAKSGKREHSSTRTAYEEESDIVAVLSIRGLRLYIHTVYAVEHIEIIHINRAGESFHSREHIGKRNSGQHSLVTVDIEI